MSDDLGTTIARFSTTLVEPLVRGFSGPFALQSLLRQVGWRSDLSGTAYDAVTAAFTVVNDAEALIALVEAMSQGGEPSAAQLTRLVTDAAKLVDDLSKLGTSITGLTVAPFDDPAFWQTFPGDLVQLLVVETLRQEIPILHAVLVVLGAIRYRPFTPPAAASVWRVAYEQRCVDWAALATLFSDPAAHFRALYGIGGPALKEVELFTALERALVPLGVPARQVPIAAARETRRALNDPARELRLPILEGYLPGGGPVALGLIVTPVPAKPASGRPSAQWPVDGLLISSLAHGHAAASIALAPGISLQLAGGFDADGALTAEVSPRGVSVAVTAAGSTDARAVVVGQPDKPWRLLGDANGTRIELAGFIAGVEVKGGPSPVGQDAGIELGLRGISFVVQAGERDGFLKVVLPADPLEIKFDLTLGASAKRGIYLGGGAGFEYTFRVNTRLGPIAIDTIDLAIAATPTALDIVATMTGALELGPLTAVVQKIGLGTKLSFGQPGNLGQANLGFGFHPPSGIGVSLSKTAVSGGGFLAFDVEKQQYSGVLRLNITNIVDVKVIGILNARLPDGHPGYSLLLIITGEFPPIQLGLGFTLNGVGGLIGVNRAAVVEVLRAGLRNGAMDSILFPPDPLNNVPALLSTLGSVFPVAEGRYVFGPMVKIGWGSPTILTLDLALILEIPDPVRLIVLGRLKAVLPDEKNPVVQIRMDAMGVLDFSRNELSLDATLYDSRILTFTITGDMALRLVWGARPNFILSVGGFHPHFEAPPGLTKLSRLAIVLVDREKDGVTARVRFESYLALTSNTVQFGARVDMYFKTLGVEAAGFLSFDALIHFSPLTLEAQLGAAVALSFNGMMLMGADLALTLTGPTPWHAFGEVRFDFLGAKQRVPVEVKTGDESAPPPLVQPVAVRDLLIQAIEDPRNWQAQPPDGADSIVALRIAEGDDPSKPRPLMVHPLGSLAVRQRVLPLTVPITRYGNAPVQGDRFFDVVVPLSGARVEPLQEQFAMSQYKVMRDDEKLAAPSFEGKKAGVRFRDDKFVAASAVKQAPALEYETRTMVSVADTGSAATPAMTPATASLRADPDSRAPREAMIRLAPDRGLARDHHRKDVSQMEHLIALGAAANAPTRAKGKSRYFAVASDGTGA